VLPAIVLIALVVAVAVLSVRARHSRVRLRTCCSIRPSPPEDLDGREA
jgi:hypothetical protein